MNLQQAYTSVSQKIPLTDVAVEQRLRRGYELINSYGYSIVPHNGYYIIAKASTSLLEDNSRQYVVTIDTCSCPDYENARGNLCKHRLAIMMLTEMKGDV